MTQLINCNLTQQTMSMLHKSLHEENMNIQNDLRMKIKNNLNRIINMYYKTKHSSIISTYYDYDRIRVSYINRGGSLCESYLDTVIVENIRTI